LTALAARAEDSPLPEHRGEAAAIPGKPCSAPAGFTVREARMRTLLMLGCVAALLVPAALHAQSCDVMVLQPSWSTHPHPDSIYVNFRPDVTSSQAQNPRLYDMMINMRYGVALVDQHQLSLRWSHGIGCSQPPPCSPTICEEKEWSFKGVVFRDNSKCIQSGGNCVCPPLGDPVPHRKVMPKPAVPTVIEIEIVPLNLQGCTPINPSNDRVQFNYPGLGPTPLAPAAPSPLVLALLTALLGLAVLSVRLLRRAV
jgi:hypothetical protein